MLTAKLVLIIKLFAFMGKKNKKKENLCQFLVSYVVPVSL